MASDELVALWNIFGRMGAAELCDLELHGVESIDQYPPDKAGGGCIIIGPITPIRLTDEVQDPRPADVLRPLVKGHDVVMIDSAGFSCAAIGDRLATLALSLGAVGVVTDGPVRDVRRIMELPLGVWSTGRTPLGGGRPVTYAHQPAPFELFGHRWQEDDWYAQDRDGALRLTSAGRRELLARFGDDVTDYME